MKLHEDITYGNMRRTSCTRLLNAFKLLPKRIQEVHKDRYTYNNFVFLNMKENSWITCSIHGNFSQSIGGHLRGSGCPKCGRIEANNKKRKTTNQFIEESKIVHGYKYNYDDTEYIDSETKVKIFCNKCDTLFYQKPGNHLNGKGCSICYGNKKKTTEEFKQQALEIYGDSYNYNEANYINAYTKVKVKCNICKQDFIVAPAKHINARTGCPKCFGTHRKTTNQFIEESKIVHGDKYNYSKVDYINYNTKVKIRCNNCLTYFIQTPGSHLTGNGCKSCCKIGFNPNKKAILYYICIDELYYKIGITNRTIEARFGKDYSRIRIVKEWNYEIGQDAYDKEQLIIKEFKDSLVDKELKIFEYTGNTEIFNHDILLIDG